MNKIRTTLISPVLVGAMALAAAAWSPPSDDVDPRSGAATTASAADLGGMVALAETAQEGSEYDTIDSAQLDAADTVELQLLSINDFHGRLESPSRDAAGRPVGGAAQLAGLVDQLREENPNTLFLSAGDNIGASTFISAVDDDNPTLDALSLMGMDAAAVGNHEFDKGMTDLTGRVIPRSDFPYLGANVYRGDERALPAYDVQTVGGVQIGIIGVVTEQTASLVSPDGIAGLSFRDPVAEAASVAAQLKDGDLANGEADVVVLLAHEGAASENIDSVDELKSDEVFGEFMRLGEDVDVIFSGHTHQAYAFTDGQRPVVQAGDYGELVGRTTLTVDIATTEIVHADTKLVDVVGAPLDGAVAALVADAQDRAEDLGEQPLGSITADIRRAFTDSGAEDRGRESALGNFIADVQLAGTSEAGRGGAQIAFMNPGGLRADLVHAPDGVVTYAEAFAVQPFANDVVTKTFTGAQIKQVLEQQWQPAGASRPVLWLGVSEGFRYTYLPDNSEGSRITGMWLDDVPIDPAGTYRVTVNSFLASGGDNFLTLAEGTDPATTGNNDLTMLMDYFEANSPVTADTASRSSVGVPDPDPVVPTCGGLDATIVGTPGDDRLRGADGRDVIVGLGGDDVIIGASGNDVICGGDGRDRLLGGSGNDSMFGGAGRDVLDGESGDDTLSGHGAGDRLIGNSGDDDLSGGGGADTLSGTSGSDHLDGGPGDPDRCDGGSSTDTGGAGCEAIISIP